MPPSWLFVVTPSGVGAAGAIGVGNSAVKVVEWNQAPNGTYFPKKGSDTKAFEGNVPQSVLDSLGLK